MAATEAALSPGTPTSGERDENSAGTEGIKITDLNDSRADLLNRIQSLKKDLQDWRGKLDTQVKTYRKELGDLRTSLNVEVEQLKSDFQDLRDRLRKQLDATSNLTRLIPDFPTKVDKADQ